MLEISTLRLKETQSLAQGDKAEPREKKCAVLWLKPPEIKNLSALHKGRIKIISMQAS